jgi:hypothetical protein
LKYILT